MAVRRDAGFSLIAVLVAIVLLSIGLLAISRASTQVLAMHTSAASRSAALGVARAHMETLRSQDPSTIASQSEVVVNAEGQLDASGTFYRTVVVDSVSHNLKAIRVRVTWPRASAPVELVTMAFFSVE